MRHIPLALSMLARERFCWSSTPREPESCIAMDSDDEITGFHVEGGTTGALAPVYHFNAAQLSTMLPSGGKLLDLGCGSGRFIAHLARCRPDISVLGIDLSEQMVAKGREYLAHEGLDRQVQILSGDMTDFEVPPKCRFDAVSSIFALHHLPNIDLLRSCLTKITHLQNEHNSNIWLFDHARPQHSQTSKAFPRIFTPKANIRFQTDSTASLKAAFTFAELSAEIRYSKLSDIQGQISRVLQLYQVHCSSRPQLLAQANTWQEPKLPREARQMCRGLQLLFPSLKLG